jgi:ABC-type dipeptide/oligopeptide/nickel transport system permease subunit
MKDFSKLCTPARVYFAIAVIASVIALLNRVSFLAVGLKLIFAFMWTFALSWLCDKGYQNLSWFLVLLPYIIILAGVLGIMNLTKGQHQLLKSTQLQGALGK